MRRILPTPLVVLALLVLGLAGCSSPVGGRTGPRAAPLAVPKVGQCVAKEVRDGTDVGPDFTTVVPCTRSHGYEVIGVQRVPARFLRHDSGKRRAQLAEVGPRAGRAAQRLQAVLWPACQQALRRATGLARLSFRHRPARRLRVTPLLRGASPWLNLAPAPLWAKHPEAVCSVRYAGPTPPGATRPGLRPVRSPDRHPVIARWRHGLPLPFRLCASVRSGDPVACARRHGVEFLFTLDFKAAYGPGFLGAQDDLSALPTRAYAKVVAVCRRLYRQTGHRVPHGLTLNYLYSRADNTDARRLVMSCVLQARHDRLTGFEALR